ncbi:MAG: sensor histidine kinase, partial [Acidimicrobiales bacterium]
QIEAQVRTSGGARIEGRPLAPGPPRAPGLPPTPPADVVPLAPGGPGGLGAGSRSLAAVVQVPGALRISQPLGGGRMAVLTSSEAPVGHAVGSLVLVEVLGSLAILGLAAMAVGGVVRFTLAPLREVVAVASDIASGQRGRRLHPRRSGTELGRMAAAFDAMVGSLEQSAAAAEDSEARMRQFLADASHELRTPVASVQATLETLLRDDPGRAERERLELVAIHEARRVGQLVEDLLHVVRSESVDSEKSNAEVDIVAVVGTEVDRLRQRGVTVQLAITGGSRPGVVRGDPEALGRALANLLENAAHAGPPVAVRARRERHRFVVEVRDSGPGVPAAQRDRIFERFVRLDHSRSRARGGSGLGLSIARVTALAHGGDVECLPARTGARFQFWLPLETMQQAEWGSPSETV